MMILRTTDNGTVRFNPNLYANGKVCLSILGTWSGPGWSPVHTLASVLLSVLSLMNAAPYYNEPGFEEERKPGQSAQYNLIVRHETMRVAVVGVLENPTWAAEMDSKFLEAAKAAFLTNYDKLQAVCKENAHLNGQPMQDPFEERHRSFDFDDISKRAQVLKEKIENGSFARK